MNGNELNSMAQRYKEEMMRLYKKSGASDSTSKNGQSTSAASETTKSAMNTTAQSGSQGTAYGTNQTQTSQQQARAYQTANIPVSCECRFPTAESIINSLAQIPVTLPITPEDNPPAVEQGSYDTPIQPRTANQQSPQASSQAGVQTNMTDNSQASSGLKGIMLSSSPDEATYTVPSESENPQEIMPNFPMPADIPADSSEAVPQTSSFLPSMSWAAATGDNSWGFLQFDIFTAGGAYPVSGALVTVSKKLSAGMGLVRILFSNRSGLTATIALPAPSGSLSQTPQSTSRPFSEYSVTVRAKGYYTIKDINIPIFAGIKTVQPIDLIPLPEYGGLQPRNSSENSSESISQSSSENSITDTPSVG